MDLHRARTMCPICSHEEEVWFYKSKIAPVEILECIKCSYVYEAKDFIVNLLELRQNLTLSTLSASSI